MPKFNITWSGAEVARIGVGAAAMRATQMFSHAAILFQLLIPPGIPYGR
jgi:hypothetical protein